MWRRASRETLEAVRAARRRRPGGATRAGSTAPTSRTTACACRAAAIERRVDGLDAGPAGGDRRRRRPRCGSWPRPCCPDDRQVTLPVRPERDRAAPGRSTAAGCYVPGGRARLPVEPDHGASCRPRSPACRASPSSAPRGRTAARRPSILATAGLLGVDEVYAAGGAARDRRARLRHGHDRPGGRDRRPREPLGAGGQAPGGGHWWASTARRSQRGDDHRRRLRRSGRDGARPAGPGRARGRLAGRARQRRPRGDRRPSAAALADLPEAVGPITLVECASMPLAIELAEAFAPEHLEIATRDPEAIASRITALGGGLRRTQLRDRLRRLRRRLQPRPAHRGRRALRVGPRAHHVPAEDVRGRHDRRGRRGAHARTWPRSPTPRASRCTARSAEAREARREPRRRGAPDDRRDRRARRASSSTAPGRPRSSTGVGLLRPHAHPAGPPLADRHRGRRPRGDLETGSHHTVEDVGITLGQALSTALGDRAGIERYGSALVPMDECLAQAAIDLSGRPFTAIDVPLPGRGDRRLRDRAARGVHARRSRTTPGSRCTCA